MNEAGVRLSGRRQALERERDFLLRSIADLDAELEAGDLEPDDHRRLRDDYTARAAAVLHEIDGDDVDRSLAGPEMTRRRRRGIAVWAGVVAVAVLAGFAIAQAAGSRGASDQISGDIRLTTRQRLADCQALLGPQNVLEAVQCYDAILADEPSNAEAMTYRGWVLVLTGDPTLVQTGVEWLDRAVDSDPAYPDARAFRAIVASGQDRPSDALDDLEVLDTLDPPPMITDLIDGSGLRERVEQAVAESGAS